MKPTQLEDLEKAKAKLAAIEAQIAAELRTRLADLPREHGYDTMASFMKALKAAAAGAGKSVKKAGRRTRAVITDATRAEVKKLVEAGKTGAQIVEELGISLPSVQNIKKALGLVTRRKKKK